MPIDNDPFSGMSPTDALKLRLELENRKVVTPEQKAANRRKTISDVLGMLPIVGNAMSAYDAYGSAQDAKQAFQSGDNKRGVLAAALTGVSTAGALAIPGAGKLARAIASKAPRTLFSGVGPVDDDLLSWAAKSKFVDEQGKPLVVYNGADPERAASGSMWLTDDANHAAQFGDVTAYYAQAQNPFRMDMSNFAASPDIGIVRDAFIRKYDLDPDDWTDSIQAILNSGGYDADEIVHDAMKFGRFDSAILDNWEGAGKTYLVKDRDAVRPSGTPVKFR